MKHFYLFKLVIALMLAPIVKGVAQCNLLVKTFGSIVEDGITAMDSGPDGSVYFAGHFSGTITFGTFQLTSAGDKDVYIVKMAEDGTVLWAKKGGGLFLDGASDLVVDENGNVYVAGFFNSSATFESQTITTTTKATFLAKYNTSGTLQWLKKRDYHPDSRTVALDFYNSNLYMAERSGNGSDSIIVYNSADNSVISKLCPFENYSGGYINDFKIDGNGNIYIAGVFYNSELHIGGTILTSNGNGEVFLAKYNNSFSFQWAVQAGGSGSEGLSSLHIDASNNVYIAGSFQGTAYFNSTGLNTNGDQDIFLAKYDTDGNLTWVRNAGSSSCCEYAFSISSDNSGNVYLTGSANSSQFTFYNYNYTGNSSVAFLAKINSTGLVLDVIGISGYSNNDNSTYIHLNANGKLFIYKAFKYSMNFGASQLTSKGDDDIAIARISDFDDLRTSIPELCVVVVDPTTSKNKIVWNKPVSSKITQYNVYRENAVGEMKKIGSVPYSGNNYFIDNASAPLQQAYLYSISLTDVCGNESQISNYEHKTMHLQMYPGPNNVWSLLWSTYWGVDVEYYRIKRGTSSTNLIPLDSISGSTGEILTYTDLNPPTGTVYYSVEAVTDADCDGLSSSNPSSNKVSYVASTTDVMDALNSAMTLYPNPTNGQFTIEWNNFNAGSYAVKVMNMEGVIVYQSSALNASSANVFDLSSFAKGLYTLEIEVNGSKIYKKVSVQ